MHIPIGVGATVHLTGHNALSKRAHSHSRTIPRRMIINLYTPVGTIGVPLGRDGLRKISELAKKSMWHSLGYCDKLTSTTVVDSNIRKSEPIATTNAEGSEMWRGSDACSCHNKRGSMYCNDGMNGINERTMRLKSLS